MTMGSIHVPGTRTHILDTRAFIWRSSMRLRHYFAKAGEVEYRPTGLYGLVRREIDHRVNGSVSPGHIFDHRRRLPRRSAWVHRGRQVI